MFEKKMKRGREEEVEELDLDVYDQDIMNQIDQKDNEAILWEDTDADAIKNEKFDIFG
jgi:hypothetical protein